MAKNESYSNTKMWSLGAAAFFSAGASVIMLYSSVDRNDDVTNLRLVTTKVKQYLLRSLKKDFPLWIGSGWLLLRQPSSATSNPSTRALDFLMIGLLLTYRESTRDDTSEPSGKGDTSGNDTTTNAPTTQDTAQSVPPPRMPKTLSWGELIEPPPPTERFLDNSNIHKKFPNGGRQRYIELMVHNVSHTDMVLSLDAPPVSSSHEDSFCLCRPRFSAFDFYSKKVSNVLKSLTSSALVRFPRYERSDDTRRIYIKSGGGGGVNSPEQPPEQPPPIGFALPDTKSLQVTAEELKDLRVRGRDANRLTNITSSRINAVFFPLLSMLMPQWKARIEQTYYDDIKPKQVLILVSGVGTPRNWTHSMTGNSTQVCAQLMQHYLQTLYPDLVVVQVYSETNIFRYDENIYFVQNELMPCIQSYRDAHAKGLPYPDEVVASSDVSAAIAEEMRKLPFMADWKKSFNVTLSYADGSPARNHAIQAALRPYRPTYYHCWQLKTFWHESKIVESDIEVHSFEDMETLPALSTDQLQDTPVIQQVVDEIKAFSNDMTRVLADKNQDIQRFWLRKTQKPVLAVLAVQLDSGKIKLYRGTNMEVSMPTGSLCAERNVIGTALADNPSLRRHNLIMIAVLSVPSPSKPVLLSRANSLASYNSIPSLMADSEHRESPMLVPRPTDTSQDEEWLLQQDLTGPKPHTTVSAAIASPAAGSSSKTPPLHPNSRNNTSMAPPSFALGPPAATSPPSTPARRIPVYSSFDKKKQQKVTKSRKSTLIIHSNEDLNPLRPCGACNEWLKKIAESNPYFQILTFTDAGCNGVYCTPCEE